MTSSKARIPLLSEEKVYVRSLATLALAFATPLILWSEEIAIESNAANLYAESSPEKTSSHARDNSLLVITRQDVDAVLLNVQQLYAHHTGMLSAMQLAHTADETIGILIDQVSNFDAFLCLTQ